jgi:phosphomannomutase/phosphoglucomutase
MELFGSSGIRGVVNVEFGPDDALAVAQAAGTELGAERVAVARDTRATGRMLVDAAASGFASVGVSVDRLGVVPTPGLQAYCEREGVPGLMVTASHNPPEYNGIKLVAADGVELSRERLEAIESRLFADADEPVAWNATGDTREVDDARERYVRDLLAATDRERVAAADLTVAVDPGHGAGALTSPDFFRQFGCTVRTIHAQADGHFPGRDPEPVEAQLDDLQRFVRVTGADLGVAHDGDADRAIFVDEHGELLSGDATLAALAAAELAAGDTVVSAVNASQRLVDAVDTAGANLSLTPIGSTFIVTRIRELERDGETVPVAGEGNGGVIFPRYRIARDGAYTAARFLELLADADAPASEVVATYDGYENVRRNLPCEDDTEREAMLEALERAAGDADADLTTTDGYRLDYGDAWVLARPSGTEPVIRVYAEARNADRARELAAGMVDAAEQATDTGQRTP